MTDPSHTNTGWQDFLQSLQGVVEQGHVRHYGNPSAELQAARDRNILVDLSHLALVRAEGADTESFLQGQLTNDIKQVTAEHAQISAYCNPKGRMFAIFLISKLQESWFLQLPAELAESTVKRLRMFVLRAKVKFERETNLIASGLSGPDAESLLQAFTGKVPTAPYNTTTTEGITIVRVPGPHPRFEIIADTPSQITLWQTLLKQGVQPAGASTWSWLDIQMGVPTVLPGTVEEFVPQMANLDAISGVSFTKGCYPGQEIVARMHYLGRLKQRMFKMHVNISIPPVPGTPVYAPNFPDQSAGNVVAAEVAPQGGCDLLVIAQLSSVNAGEIHLESATGAMLRLEPLPYELPAATK